jgi:hypothetical protein
LTNISSKKDLDSKHNKKTTRTDQLTLENINKEISSLQSQVSSSSASSIVSTLSKEEEKQNINWKNHIEPILNQLEVYFKEYLVDKFCDASDHLNSLLEQYQMFSKTFSKRATILKIIFKYLDTDCDRIKIKISRIILNVNYFI